MPLKVPAFLLRRLYVKGSLRATADGFEFELKNMLGSGYANRLLPLVVNGTTIDLASCFFYVEGDEHPFAAVTAEHPFSLKMNKTSVLRVRGHVLPAETVKLRIGFEVQGLGELSFEVTDSATES